MFRKLVQSILLFIFLGNFALKCDGSPGLFTLLGFKSEIEKLPGGGDLLQALVDNMDGVTAEQLKQVSALMPLIDAKHGKPTGGFLKLMSTIDATPAGHQLLHKTIGILSNISHSHIQDVNTLVPMLSGQANRSESASIVSSFISGNTGMDILHGFLGSNLTFPVQTAVSAVSELLQSGSIGRVIETLVTPGGKANQLLFEYIHKLGGQSLVNAAHTILPIAGPVLSLAFSSSSNDTANYTMVLLRELNHNLQNVTVQELLGSMIAKLTSTVLGKAVDIFAGFETYHDLYNITISQPPLEGLVSLIGNLNTTLIEELFGNSSVGEHVIDIINHAGSVEELGLYIIQMLTDIIGRPSATEFIGELLAKGSMHVLTTGFDFLVTLVDNPEELFNLSLVHPFTAVATLLEDLNATKLEEILGNSSLADEVINLVLHSDTEQDLGHYLFQRLLQEIQKPQSQETIGDIIANINVYILTKGYNILVKFVDNPEELTKLSFLKPFHAAVTIIQDLNATKLEEILGNSSLAKIVTEFVAHANSLEDLTIYLLQKVLQHAQKPSVLATIGRLLANETSITLKKGFTYLASVVDDPVELTKLSLFNPVTTIVAVIDNLNITKLEYVLGDSKLADDVIMAVSILKSPSKIIKYISRYLWNPAIVELIGSFFGDPVAAIIQTGAILLSSAEDDFYLSNRTLSLGTLVELFQNVNKTELDMALDNSSLSDDILSMISSLQSPVSSLQSPSELTSSRMQCISDLDTVFLGVMNLDKWALRLLDASGKPGSSVLQGAVKFFGNYDECLAVSTTVKSEDGSGDRQLKGSYCRLAFTLPQALLDKTGAMDTPMPLPVGFVPALEWHLCLPRSCDENTLSSALSILPLEAVNSSVYKVECTHDQDIAHDTGAIVAVTVLCILIVLTVVGTLYDVITGEQRRLKSKYGTNDEKFDGPAIAAYNDNNTSVKGKSSNGIAMVAINGVKVDNSDMPDSDNISTSTQPYETTEDEENYDGVCRRLLLSFSFCRNTDKIFNTTKREGSLGCIHGIRVLSMAWIILGHIIVYTKGASDENVTEVLKQIKDFTMQAVVNASLATDTFFLIGGCLVAYLFIQDAVKTGKLTGRHMVMYYVHRFWRLWPLYLVVLMLYTCLFKYMMDGPLRSDGIAYDNIHCQSNWWTNVLYINNVYKTDEGCMRWTWFMASDMQFYIIAPIALVPVALSVPAVGIVVMVFLFMVQIATYAYKEYSVDGTLLKNVDQFETEIYFKPWCRVGVFSMGMLLGYILNKTKRRVHIPRFMLVVGWQICLTIGLLCTYITWNEWKVGHLNWSRDTRLVHETLARPGWALFVSWIIFVCCTGHGGVVNRLLSWSAWLPLGRLTYGAYLIHPILITYTDFSKRALVYVDFIFLAYQFIGTFVLSYALSYLLSVLVEAPCMALERVVLGRYRRQH